MGGMSTVKSPQEKKRLSLGRDCRNVYGENSKASRENIPRGKQRQHRNERRSVGQALRVLSGVVDEDGAADAELLTKVRSADSRHKGFKKKPDVPLGIVLANRESGKPKFAREGPSPAKSAFPKGFYVEIIPPVLCSIAWASLFSFT
jgi:hypothetical protein